MSIVVGLLVSMCVFAGGMAGLQLYRLLPPHHLTTETREVVRLGINMISILAALVLGLLTASAKGQFDRADQQLRSYAADIAALDQTLRQMGPQAEPIRQDLLQYTDEAVRTTWPEPGQAEREPLESKSQGKLLEGIPVKLLGLLPQTDSQHWLRAQALEVGARLIQTRWMMLVNQRGTISPLLVVIVVTWITLIFASFGLDAPRNATVVVAFLICSLSIGTSLFLILDIDSPFDGIMIVSGEPMQAALAHLRAPM